MDGGVSFKHFRKSENWGVSLGIEGWVWASHREADLCSNRWTIFCWLPAPHSPVLNWDLLRYLNKRPFAWGDSDGLVAVRANHTLSQGRCTLIWDTDTWEQTVTHSQLRFPNKATAEPLTHHTLASLVLPRVKSSPRSCWWGGPTFGLA